MNHAKKMVLISPDALKRLNTPTTDNISVDNIENDMNKVLHDDKLEDRMKWPQYQQMLQRSQFFHDQLRQPMELPIIEQAPVGSKKENFEEEILRILPKAYKTKGELLFKRLCDSNLVSWDDHGTVSINSVALPGSNITDLVCDVVRCKKTGNPSGWRQFLELLRTINVPQELIGNPRRREALPPSPRPVFPTHITTRRRTISLPRSQPRRWSNVTLR